MVVVAAAHTGKTGDGNFCVPTEQGVRIRTAETGVEAI